jgi:hypothetical protein
MRCQNEDPFFRFFVPGVRYILLHQTEWTELDRGAREGGFDATRRGMRHVGSLENQLSEGHLHAELDDARGENRGRHQPL